MSQAQQNTQRNPREKLVTWGYRALMVWTILGAAAILYGLGIVLKAMEMPVGIAIWTAIIVFVLRGLVDFLSSHGFSRMAAVLLAYVVLILGFCAIVLLMSSPFLGIGQQFSDMTGNIPAYVQSLGAMYQDFTATHPEIMSNPTIAQIANDVAAAAASWANELITSGFGIVADVGNIVSGTIFCVGFALVVAFWILLISPDMGREIRRVLDGRHQESLEFFHFTFTRVVGGYIKGTLLQCGIIAICCMIVFMVLGIPNAIAFGIITGLLNIIPVVGPWLGGIAAAGAALPTSIPVALLALGITIAIQQVVYTFISPKIMSDSVDVHPLLVICAMTVGLALGTQMNGYIGGLVGMLLGIPVAAMGKALFVYFFERRTGRTIVAEDGVFFKGVPSQGAAPDPRADALSPARISARIKQTIRHGVEHLEGVDNP